MNTFGDLKDAVKRYLTSNVTLVNLTQGAPSSQEALEVQVDIAIKQAANSARKYAEKLHDFSECEGTGRAYLTNGSLMNLKRCVIRQSYEDLRGEDFGPALALESSPTDFPSVDLFSRGLDITGEVFYAGQPRTFARFWPTGTANEKTLFSNLDGFSCFYNETGWEIFPESGTNASWISVNAFDNPWQVVGAYHVTDNPTGWQVGAVTTGTPVATEVVLPYHKLESIKFSDGGFTGFAPDVRYAIVDVIPRGDRTQVFFGAVRGVELTVGANFKAQGILATLGENRTAVTATKRAANGVYYPIKLRKRRNLQIEHFQIVKPWSDESDRNNADCSQEMLVLYKNFAQLVPAPDMADVAIDGSFWLPDYVEDTDTDFILEHGFDFMTWQTVIDVNHLLQKFIPRQEGTLAPPTKSRDEALGALILWDSTRYDGSLIDDLE
jgi:hypothetical protein